MEALREIFVKFAGEIDTSAWDKAEKRTDALEKSMDVLGGTMPAVAQQAVPLSQQLGNVNQGLSTAGVNTGIFGKALSLLGNPIAMAAAAIAALVLSALAFVAAAIRAAQATFGFVTAMADLGTQLNIQANRLAIATDRLEAWRRVARGANIETGTLEGAFSSLGDKMTEALTQRGSEAAQQFRRLGITQEELRRSRPDQIFQRIGERIRAASGHTEQFRIATRLFGASQGRLLLPVLRQTNREFEEQLALQRQLQPDLQAYGEASNRVTSSVDRMNSAIDGLKQSLMVALAPAVEYVVNAVTGLITQFRESPRAMAIVDWAVRNLIAGFTLLGYTIQAAITIAMSVFGPFIRGIVAIGVAFVSLGLIVEDFIVWLRGGESVIGELVGSFGQVNASILSFGKTMMDQFPILRDMQQYIQNIVSGATDAYNAIARFVGAPGIGPASSSPASSPGSGPSTIPASVIANTTTRSSNTNANITTNVVVNEATNMDAVQAAIQNAITNSARELIE
jgi:hypothetical protein